MNKSDSINMDGFAERSLVVSSKLPVARKSKMSNNAYNTVSKGNPEKVEVGIVEIESAERLLLSRYMLKCTCIGCNIS